MAIKAYSLVGSKKAILNSDPALLDVWVYNPETGKKVFTTLAKLAKVNTVKLYGAGEPSRGNTQDTHRDGHAQPSWYAKAYYLQGRLIVE